MTLLLPSPPKATVTPWGGPLGAGPRVEHGEKDSHCQLPLLAPTFPLPGITLGTEISSIPSSHNSTCSSPANFCLPHSLFPVVHSSALCTTSLTFLRNAPGHNGTFSPQPLLALGLHLDLNLGPWWESS